MDSASIGGDPTSFMRLGGRAASSQSDTGQYGTSAAEREQSSYIVEEAGRRWNPWGLFFLSVLTPFHVATMADHDDGDNDNSTADAHFPDSDSAVGSDTSSSFTQSLRSSLLESIRLNGRAYHRYRDGQYFLPEDEQEQERLDMQHEMFLRTFDGKLRLAPITGQLEEALDLGTGTGIWCLDFADEHPECNVLGIDLSPMQPTYVPPNCKFEVDDYEQPWTFRQKFDYVHGRCLLSSFSDGKRLLQQAYDALRPGGWLELQDVLLPIAADDGTMEGTEWQRWNELFSKAMIAIGRDPADTGRYKQWMIEIGFKEVVIEHYKWPQNPWPKDPKLKDLGRWNMVNTLDGLYGFSARPFMEILGMSMPEVQVFLSACRKDIQNRAIHSYWPV